MPKPIARICIPTTRPGNLKDIYDDLARQTVQGFEVRTTTELGNLAEIRNSLAMGFDGEFLIFLDDDIRITDKWFESIISGFKKDRVCAVSGPAIISERFRDNRDLFRYRRIKFLYDKIFCSGKGHLPGHITDFGSFTTGSSLKTCDYEGEVMFAEACNMAFKNDLFQELRGFDESYEKTSEWCEPDLCFRMRRMGYRVWFTKEAKIFHHICQSGSYKRRTETSHRIRNFKRFKERWLKKSWKSEVYYWFFVTYMFLKGRGLV